MISVVLPCYNLDKYIEYALICLLNQTYKHFEVICINDGSTDGTLDILKKYEHLDNRIRVISKNNGGVSSARNLGILNSKGEYVYFLDGDDQIENNLFEKAIAIFEANKEIDIFSFGFDLISERKKVIKKYCFKKFDKQIINGKVFLSNYFHKKIRQCMCSFIIRKNIIDKNNVLFTEGVSHCEDQEFQIKAVLNSKKIYYDYNCYFHYLQRSGSAENKPLTIKNYDSISTLMRVEEYLKINSDIKILNDFYTFFSGFYLYSIKLLHFRKHDIEYKEKVLSSVYILNKVKISFTKYGILVFLLAKIYRLYNSIANIDILNSNDKKN